MDRQQVIDIIERTDFPGKPPLLYATLERKYEQWRENERKLSDAVAAQADLQAREREKRELEAGIAEKDRALARSQAAVKRLQAQITEKTSAADAKSRALSEKLAGLEQQCAELRKKTGDLESKHSEVESLRRKLESCREEEARQRTRIDGFSEDEQQNLELVRRMEAFVERLERHEQKMSELMDSIWGDLKQDSFDRMCGNRI